MVKKSYMICNQSLLTKSSINKREKGGIKVEIAFEFQIIEIINRERDYVCFSKKNYPFVHQLTCTILTFTKSFFALRCLLFI